MLRFLIISLFLASFVTNVNADYFEGKDENNLIFFEINENKIKGYLVLENKIITINSNVKYYKDGNFKSIVFNPKLIIIGTPFENGYLINILDVHQKQHYLLEVKLLPILKNPPNDIIQESLSMEDKITTTVIEKIPTPLSEYLEDKNRKITILYQIPKKLSIDQHFDFDIRVVDPSKNVFKYYFETEGFVNDVHISSLVRNPDGIIINNFTGYTTNYGHYSPDDVTFFHSIFSSKIPYTWEVSAIKYYPDSETFSSASLEEEFFVYVPERNNYFSICDPGYYFDGFICILDGYE